MQDKVTVYRLITVPLEMGNRSNIWNNLNISKFYSRRN